MDNDEQSEDDKILMQSLVKDNIKVFCKYDFKCDKCGKSTSYYVNKQESLNDKNTLI